MKQYINVKFLGLNFLSEDNCITLCRRMPLFLKDMCSKNLEMVMMLTTYFQNFKEKNRKKDKSKILIIGESR